MHLVNFIANTEKVCYNEKRKECQHLRCSDTGEMDGKIGI